MARSFSTAKIASSALVSHGFSNALFRRGFAAAAAPQGVASSAPKEVAARIGAMMKKEESARSSEKVSWVPDPVTGYYRPENCTTKIDAAELRAMLLKPEKMK